MPSQEVIEHLTEWNLRLNDVIRTVDRLHHLILFRDCSTPTEGCRSEDDCPLLAFETSRRDDIDPWTYEERSVLALLNFRILETLSGHAVPLQDAPNYTQIAHGG